MDRAQETPRPPATPEFGVVTPDGPTHVYPMDGCMRVRKLSVGPHDNNVYLIECTGENAVLIVDASASPERLAAEIDGLEVVGIAITHDHPDHLVHLDDLLRATGAPALAHPSLAGLGARALEDGATIAVGSLAVEVIHTPGHTPNSLCLRARGFLFSGDALFPAGPGNTSGPGASFEQAMASVDRLLERSTDEVRVCPGHGLDTTIGRERPYVETWRARGW